MKVILPKHREFLIRFEDGYAQEAEAWEALNQIVKDYSVDGKSVYSETFIEDNEDAYIDRIVQLLKDQNLYKMMSGNCRNHALDYSLDKQIRTIEKYIDEE